MKIDISKENDVVYFTVDAADRKILNFDNLVKLSKETIDSKENTNFKYEVFANSELQLYKETIEKVFESILNDTELLSLLKEKQTDEALTNTVEDDSLELISQDEISWDF